MVALSNLEVGDETVEIPGMDNLNEQELNIDEAEGLKGALEVRNQKGTEVDLWKLS